MTVLSLRSTRNAAWMCFSFHGNFINFSQVVPQLLIGTSELSVNRVEVLEESPVHIIWYSSYSHQDAFLGFCHPKRWSRLLVPSLTLPTWQHIVWGGRSCHWKLSSRPRKEETGFGLDSSKSLPVPKNYTLLWNNKMFLSVVFKWVGYHQNFINTWLTGVLPLIRNDVLRAGFYRPLSARF